MKTNQLSQAEALSLFTLRAGVLVWKIGRGKCRAGHVAGTYQPGEYSIVAYKGKNYSAHRIIWAMVHGDLHPMAIIDHINGEPSDNRPENLRLATPAINCLNSSKADRRNVAGVRGVHAKTRNGKTRYYARITIDGKTRSLGAYDTPEAAGIAYSMVQKHEIDLKLAQSQL